MLFTAIFGEVVNSALTATGLILGSLMLISSKYTVLIFVAQLSPNVIFLKLVNPVTPVVGVISTPSTYISSLVPDE
ncbi:hypothetical protein D3C71_2077310 [compost metagenome]